jgi:hypothetical protein
MKSVRFPARSFGIWLALAVARLSGEELYVSTKGNDSNPGTVEQPLRTITRACKEAAPGLTIHVAPGLYDDYRTGWGIHLNSSGTPTNRIVLRSDIRGAAIIDGGNKTNRNQGFYLDGNYWTVEGFEIRHCPKGGIAIYGNGNRIINNEIHHNGNPASNSTNGMDGVYSNDGTRDNYYAGNSIHDNGRPGSRLDHGLYLCGKNETVINNLLTGNAAFGLQIAGYSGVTNMKVYNNVIAFNGRAGIMLWLAITNVDIRNNIFFKNGTYGIDSSDAHGEGVVVDHNLSFGNGSGDYLFTGRGSDFSCDEGTNYSANPRFLGASRTKFDAHLREGSPGIRAGVNLHRIFDSDKSGATRPGDGPWDLGVFKSR